MFHFLTDDTQQMHVCQPLLQNLSCMFSLTTLSPPLLQAVGRATRRTPRDLPDDHGVVVLMCHVNLDKYKACGTLDARNLALRDDLASSAGGDFQSVAEFLLALKHEDEHFQLEMLQQVRRRRQRQQQDKKHGAAKGGDSSSSSSDSEDEDDKEGRRNGVSSGRFKFDFSLAPGFQQALMLDEEQADEGNAGATQGSCFLNALLLQTSCTRKEAMLQLLQQFVEEKDCMPARFEVYRGVKLGSWCQHRRTLYRRQQLSQREMQQIEAAVPRWQWPKEARISAHSNPQEMLELLKQYVAEHGVLPIGNTVADGARLGSWCAYQRTKERRGQLDREMKEALEALPNWKWVVSDGILG